jgi:glycosyltransferase involved in cell wall biosynthesis
LTLRAFLSPHIAALRELYAVTVVANTDRGERLFADPAVDVIPVPIERKISPLSDLRALVCLLATFRKRKFDVVHSVTTKAGLLAMFAACAANVPVRLHTFTGQLWITRKEPMKLLLRSVDRVIAGCATHVIVDSPSQRDFLVASGIVSAAKSTVLANGSICGVDGGRFRPDREARDRVRSVLGIPRDAVLFLYLGRLTQEKGVIDLAAAFAALAQRHVCAHLLVAGPDEEGLKPRMLVLLPTCADRAHWVDYTDRPQEYMAAADVFCLPSYREGFGQAAIEASATELPVIASRIYGVTDAVVDGETGLLHAPGDVEALRERMQTLLTQPELRERLGNAGRSRALREFSADRITRALLDYYSAATRKL